ncbi:germin-like protein subfamily 3 member 1 [Trifolium pratense]|uniref:germin-like protein subfamily 3 member 1 n=1 Tax=Trifolium pratense TaxID=57577 RepID=UPI001E69055A|nr:germin-like protein subfamily 3 member 1 [Trifolium pratense]
MKIIHILFLFTLLSSTISHASYIHDFCVGDIMHPETPTGYHCMPLENITSDDFVFHGFVAGNTNNSFNAALTSAFVTDFPGLNALGISAARLDIAEGGAIPVHTHPSATELLIMVQGEITAGFFTTSTVYSKTLKPGDLMVFPQGLLHFQVNSGKGKATAFLTFSSSNPGAQLIDLLLFSNNLPSELVAQTTFLDLAQVKKLKARFGGRG